MDHGTPRVKCMSKTEERESRILQTLNQGNKLSIEEVTAMLGISLSSARRLFIKLEETGKYVRTHGGIHLVSPKGPEYSFDALESRNLSEKKQIARCAADMIQDDDVVYLDSGTTLLQMALAIKQRVSAHQLRGARFITNSFANLLVLQGICPVILIGGEYHAGRKAFAGYPAERFVGQFLYKKSFLGADGLVLDEGYMTTDTDTAKLNEVVMRRSDESHVLLDSSKFGQRSFVSYAAVSEIGTLITDAGLTDVFAAACIQKNMTLTIAKAD